MLSEFGAGAVAGHHLDPGTVGPESNHNHSYSEEYQTWLLEAHLDAAHEAGIDGTMPWVLADFHMEWNPSTGDPHPVAWTNLKGLCTHDRTPKESYDAVQAYYQDPDFLN